MKKTSSESAPTVPAERAKLEAEVAKQRVRLAKEELKRARKRLKEAKREAKRARKRAAAARKAFKRARRAGGKDSASARQVRARTIVRRKARTKPAASVKARAAPRR